MKEGEINKSHKLPSHCSIIQVEILAIKMAAELLQRAVFQPTTMQIYVVNQAATTALISYNTKSAVVALCNKKIQVLAENEEFTFTGCKATRTLKAMR